ncbi:MAG: GNAT family N-acetyltransferase [Alphaproteobacteria bacterium]|nr:GNAT family N-acetyltransferase [Alphaproteobacteria bacterium]
MIIRDAVWPDDRAAALRFIDGLQRFEHALQPNRRIDDKVGAEYFDLLMKAVDEDGGIVRIAEHDGRAVGWAVAWPENDALYVREEERRYLYISELYVEEGLRGGGIGLALIAACEDWARGRGLKFSRIGVIAENERAWKVYERTGFAPYSLKLAKRLD